MDDFEKAIRQSFSINGLKATFLAGSFLLIGIIMLLVTTILSILFLIILPGSSTAGTIFLSPYVNIPFCISPKCIIIGIIEIILGLIPYLIGYILHQWIIWRRVKKANGGVDVSIKTIGKRVVVAELHILFVGLLIYLKPIVNIDIIKEIWHYLDLRALIGIKSIILLVAGGYILISTLILLKFSIRYIARAIKETNKSLSYLFIQEMKTTLNFNALVCGFMYTLIILLGIFGGIIGYQLLGSILYTFIHFDELMILSLNILWTIYYYTFFSLFINSVAYNNIKHVRKL